MHASLSHSARKQTAHALPVDSACIVLKSHTAPLLAAVHTVAPLTTQLLFSQIAPPCYQVCDLQVTVRPRGKGMARPLGLSRYDHDVNELVGSQADATILLGTPALRVIQKDKRRRNRRVQVEYQVTFEG